MARSKNTARKTVATGRRTGRPSNAELARRAAVTHSNFVEVVAAAASAAARGAIEAALGDGTVTTIATAQPSQAAIAAAVHSTVSPATATRRKSSPGRRRDPTSKRSQAFAMFADLGGKMPRADIVNKMVADLKIQKNVANTYYHEAEKEAGGGKRRAKPAARVAATA